MTLPAAAAPPGAAQRLSHGAAFPPCRQLKENLELMVERVKDADPGVQKAAISAISTEIRTATSSMTSVPKPLKFLRPHYESLKAQQEAMAPGSENLVALADVVSVLAMTSSAEGSRETLKFRLLGSKDDVGNWGHEYIRHLAGAAGCPAAWLQGAAGGSGAGRGRVGWGREYGSAAGRGREYGAAAG